MRGGAGGGGTDDGAATSGELFVESACAQETSDDLGAQSQLTVKKTKMVIFICRRVEQLTF